MTRTVACIMAWFIMTVSEDLYGQSPTIDRMTTYTSDIYSPGGRFDLVGFNGVYYVSDGTTWNSGAGTFALSSFALDSVRMQGTTIVFEMKNLDDNDVLIDYTDYDSGDHSSKAEIRTFGPMQIVAEMGTSDATLNGLALIHSNPLSNYSPPEYKYLTSPVGSIVPLAVHYRLPGDTWNSNIFSRTFSYQTTGEFFFSEFRSVPEPSSCRMLVVASTVLMSAISRYRFLNR